MKSLKWSLISLLALITSVDMSARMVGDMSARMVGDMSAGMLGGNASTYAPMHGKGLGQYAGKKLTFSHNKQGLPVVSINMGTWTAGGFKHISVSRKRNPNRTDLLGYYRDENGVKYYVYGVAPKYARGLRK